MTRASAVAFVAFPIAVALVALCSSASLPEETDHFECAGRVGFFPDPHNCIKYYECKENDQRHMICGTSGTQQLHWKEESVWCDFPSNVHCGERPVCDVFDKNCEVKPPNPCDDKDCSNDDWVEQGPCEKCTCQCNGGQVAGEVCCADPLVWNPHLDRCDYRTNVPECASVTTTTTTRSTTTTAKTTTTTKLV